jgi:putative transposase
MILSERHIISKKHPFFKECDSVCLKSKNLYNYANSLIENHFNSTGNYLNYNAINRIMIDSNNSFYYDLPVKVSNQTLMLLDKNWVSFFKSIKDWKKNPSKYKAKPNPPLNKGSNERFITIYESGAIYKNKKLLEKGILKLSKTKIEISSKRKNVKEIKVVPKLYSYVIEIIYEREEKSKLEDNKKIFSIDLGVNNLATVTSNQKEITPFIINGKPLKSINQYYNKNLSLIKKDLKRRNNKDSSNKIKKLTNKRENKVRDYLHKASRKIINLAKEKDVNTIVIGNNKNWKQKTSMSSKNNQNFVNIPHNTFIKMLSYKCELEGLRVILQEESYTSQASFLNLDYIPTYKPNCKEEYSFSGYRKSRGLYKIKGKENKIINADVNGSYNILRKAFPKTFDVNGIEGLSVNPMVINVGN